MVAVNTYDKKQTAASDKARRKRKARNRRRRNSILFYSVLLTLLVTVVTIASLTVFFNIRTVNVKGNSEYSAEEIVAASGIKIGQNMFRLNKFNVQTEIEQKLPYISRVTINRKLPDMLEINVTPAEEFVFVSIGTGYIVLDKNFKSLDQVAALEEGHIEIRGLKLKEYTPGKQAVFEKEEMKEYITKVIDSFVKSGIIDKINYLDLEKSYDISAGYDNRIECRLGNTDKLDLKADMIKNIIAANSVTDKAVIDITDPYKAFYRKHLE